MSVLLAQILDGLHGRHVTVGVVVEHFRRRSFGGLLFVLTLLGLLPIVSFFAGLAMLVPAVQMARGLPAPRLPDFVSARRVSVERARRLAARILPALEAVERYIRPRWLILTAPPMPILLGAVCAALGIAMILPVPLINVPPAIALAFLSLGIIERDGVMIVVGLAAAAAAFVLCGLMASFALDAFEAVFLDPVG
ncbi:MAG: exopolysaccharide biosynthesis protein [Alphaproteobacteria bacterium]|jgi:hypothetical protein